MPGPLQLLQKNRREQIFTIPIRANIVISKKSDRLIAKLPLLMASKEQENSSKQ